MRWTNCLKLIDQLTKLGDHSSSTLDLGGGLGIRYDDETPSRAQSATRQSLCAVKGAWGMTDLNWYSSQGAHLWVTQGVLLTTVQYLKHTEARNFAIVDAAMNDLMRPALYEAWHGVLPVEPRG
jgi:diaminopimelate decarboxylase